MFASFIQSLLETPAKLLNNLLKFAGNFRTIFQNSLTSSNKIDKERLQKFFLTPEN